MSLHAYTRNHSTCQYRSAPSVANPRMDLQKGDKYSGNLVHLSSFLVFVPIPFNHSPWPFNFSIFARNLLLMRIILSLSLLVLVFPVVAQILNIEKNTLDKDTTKKVLGNAGLSFSLNNRSASETNPVNFIGIVAHSSVALFPGKHRISLINRFDYLRINDAPFINTGFQHVRINFFKERRVHPEAFAQVQYDNFRGLFPRVLTGAGMRHRLLKSPSVTFVFSVGAMYEYERWQHPESGGFILQNLWKTTNYLSFRYKISESADFNAIQYFQTGYDSSIKTFRNRYSVDANLNTRITHRLTLTTTFNLGYEHRPVVPITRTIYSFTQGINVKF
jgi:hypothetical protein